MTSTFHPKMTAEDVAQSTESTQSTDFAQRAIAAGFEVRVQQQPIDFAAEIDPSHAIPMWVRS